MNTKIIYGTNTALPRSARLSSSIGLSLKSAPDASAVFGSVRQVPSRARVPNHTILTRRNASNAVPAMKFASSMRLPVMPSILSKAYRRRAAHTLYHYRRVISKSQRAHCNTIQCSVLIFLFFFDCPKKKRQKEKTAQSLRRDRLGHTPLFFPNSPSLRSGSDTEKTTLCSSDGLNGSGFMAFHHRAYQNGYEKWTHLFQSLAKQSCNHIVPSSKSLLKKQTFMM